MKLKQIPVKQLTQELRDSLVKTLSRILEKANKQQLVAMGTWARDLVVINRNSELSGREKLKRIARAINKSGKELKPIFKELFSDIKKHGWDQRSVSMRWIISAVGVGLATAGTATFGLAGFGTAIAVSSVLVFGAGGALLGSFHEEIVRELKKRKIPTTEYELVATEESREPGLIEAHQVKRLDNDSDEEN